MSWFSLQTVKLNSLPIRLAQITDCHLLIEGGHYEGIDSAVRLQSVMAKLAECHKTQPWDAVMITGDVTQDHTPGSYEILTDYCREYLNDTTVAWLPGNHDEISCLNQHFSQPPFTTAKHLKLRHWHVLLLNTKGPTPSGKVSGIHLKEITDVLEQIPVDEPVAVFCHHHLLPVGAYIDKHITTNGETLLALLKAYPQVKCIAHGHVHQQRQTLIERTGSDDILLMATPSTSMQFKANSMARDNDDLGAAFRWFELDGGAQVSSDVIWLNSF